jgi:Domain of unknown function (DUF3479)
MCPRSRSLRPCRVCQAAKEVARQCPGVQVKVFSDRDITTRRAEVEAALDGADIFFGSLLFDYDQARHQGPDWVGRKTV